MRKKQNEGDYARLHKCMVCFEWMSADEVVKKLVELFSAEQIAERAFQYERQKNTLRESEPLTSDP